MNALKLTLVNNPEERWLNKRLQSEADLEQCIDIALVRENALLNSETLYSKVDIRKLLKKSDDKVLSLLQQLHERNPYYPSPSELVNVSVSKTIYPFSDKYLADNH